MVKLDKAEKMTIAFSDNAVAQIMARVKAYNWDALPEPEESAGSWVYGADKTYMQSLCRHWVESYDWRKFEKALNQFNHYRMAIDGQAIHFIHAKPEREGAPLVLMTHGWPGSVAEFMEVLPRLTHPQKFGGDASKAVEVIAPSLPGYGFSAIPKKVIGQKATAELWAKLMAALGVKNYIAQGGDWGSVVSTRLGLHHAREAGGCVGVHVNMIGMRPKGMGESDEDKAYMAANQMMFELEGAYFRLQATKPQTIAHGLMDSPVGIAAWITEKFHRWADKTDESGQEQSDPPFTKDQLLDNIMLYLLTGTFASSVWYYRGLLEEMGMGEIDGKIEVPCAFAEFPHEFIKPPPRKAAENLYSIKRWTKFDKGGHFAAMEQPALFADDVAAFAHDIWPK